MHRRLLRQTQSVTSLRRVLADLKAGRNIDGYLTIAVAIVVGMLSYLSIVPSGKVSSLILAVLAVLAFSLITTRTDISNSVASQARSAHKLFPDFPADLVNLRESSDDIFLVGVDLGRTIETSFGAFERNLRRGAKIRILLTDPMADDSAVDARCQASRPDVADLRNEIRHSLRKLERLKSVTGGDLEARTTRAALKFGLNYINVGKASAQLYVQLYSFRLPGESRPMLRLTAADGEWFECFRYQAEESLPVAYRTTSSNLNQGRAASIIFGMSTSETATNWCLKGKRC